MGFRRQGPVYTGVAGVVVAIMAVIVFVIIVFAIIAAHAFRAAQPNPGGPCVGGPEMGATGQPIGHGDYRFPCAGGGSTVVHLGH